jgi:hypothetical protein
MPKSKTLTSYGRVAILLIIIGMLLGIDSLWHLSFIYKLWPLIITILGIGFIGIFKTRDRKEALYLTVGICLIGFSGIAQWCVFTSWTILSHFWPLFISLSGIAVICDYLLCQKKQMWLLIGLLLMSASIVFFFVFSINPHLWWTVFLLAGISVWIAERTR